MEWLHSSYFDYYIVSSVLPSRQWDGHVLFRKVRNYKAKPIKWDFSFDCFTKISLFHIVICFASHIYEWRCSIIKHQNDAKRCNVKCQTLERNRKKIHKKRLSNIFSIVHQLVLSWLWFIFTIFSWILL